MEKAALLSDIFNAKNLQLLTAVVIGKCEKIA